ncbi:DUF6327 family protein [Mesonia aquimarina]|uniref:DUF6327 family protein n=1 Tax=Mesonia aquimarina TaxID=1504967 RepID=UPI000EF60EB6|nr:DUF6327 family protein [Mesonia aquimarina]
MKAYNSFDEINHDLKILKLQTRINKEKIKRDVHYIKEDLSPISLVANVASSIAKKAFIMKAVAKIIGIRKAKIVGKT